MTKRLALASVFLLGACTAEPRIYSEPVGIRLTASSSSAANGIVTDDKPITTEQGNPYGKFMTSAKELLAGKSPSAIVVEGAVLALAPTSTGADALGDVFAGTVAVDFLIEDSNNSYGIASAEVDRSTGVMLELDARFDSAAMTDFDYLKLLGGKFKVVVRGTAAAGFADRAAKVDLDTTLTFSAFE
jgi:hypothetical protein